MSKLRFAVVATGAFAAGIAFVLACGRGTGGAIDASVDARAADAGACEPPITRDRIYEVVAEKTVASDFVFATAACEEGDLLLGGGCWVFSPGETSPFELAKKTRPLLAHGPVPATDDETSGSNYDDYYHCVYQNGDGTEAIKVVATAKCFKPAAGP